MKIIQITCITVLLTLITFGTIIYSSCKKDGCSGVTCQNGGTCSGGTCNCPTGFTGSNCQTASDPCAAVTCYNGGTCSGGICTCPTGYTGTNCDTPATTAITYINDTYTPVSFVANGTTTNIAVGGSLTIHGLYATTLNAVATTCGTSASNAQLGVLVTWNLADAFPASGTITEALDVSNVYFYLKIQNNNSSNSINDVYVNYLLASQTSDSVIVPGNGNTYGIGYYLAYSNTQIKATSGTGYNWTWMPVIPNVVNATVTVVAN